ncbi:MAG TPA: hypothetical protein VNO79_13965 [Actinomycetota bacterium]|nr:hypothetical protein [Actinomycetota bacterium]
MRGEFEGRVVICAACATTECPHALEPSWGASLFGVRIEERLVHLVRVLARDEEEAKGAALKAVGPDREPDEIEDDVEATPLGGWSG